MNTITRLNAFIKLDHSHLSKAMRVVLGGIIVFIPIVFSILQTPNPTQAATAPFLYVPFRIPLGQPTYYLDTMTSVFDHSSPNYTKVDGKIIMFNGGTFDDECYSIDYNGQFVSNCTGPIQSFTDTADEYPRVYYNGHDGYDWDVDEYNVDVLAAAGGTIDFVGWTSWPIIKCLGYIVIVNHQNGYRTIYGHLKDGSSSFSAGNIVGVGQKIGEIGNTTGCGTSTGPHLHFLVQHFDVTNEQWRVTDPFGWAVQGLEDPLVYFNGEWSENLWVGYAPSPYGGSTGSPASVPVNGRFLGGAIISDALPPSPTPPPPPPSPSDGIELCDGINYGQPCTPFIYTSNDTCIDLGLTGWSNQADSLRFNGNYIGNYDVVMFDDNACQVYNARPGENTPDLGAFKDSISSIRIEKHSSPPPTGSDGVVLCDGTNFGQPCSNPITYTANDTCINLANIGWASRADSMRFQGSYVTGYEVVMYHDNGCSVYNARYGQDTADLGAFRNQIASIRIEQSGAPSGPNDGIDLCDGTNYGQPCQTFYYHGNDTCQNLATWGWDNRADSVRFKSDYAGGYDIIVYHDNSCNVYNARYGQDTPDMGAFKNAIASIRIEKHGPPLPDLLPQAQPGWTDPITISSVPGTNTNGTLYAGSPIYIDWSYQNTGQTNVGFHYVELYIDDQRFIRYPFSGLGAGYFGGFYDWQEIWLTPGWHRVKMVVDSDNNVNESNENNNVWQKQFYWQSINGWKGEYFNNPNLSSYPALVRDDAAVDFDWGTSSPDPAISPDNFSVRWTRAVYFSNDTYHFNLRHDDGGRIFIDDALRLDAWGTCCVVDSVDVALDTGYHAVRVEMRDTGGAANANLWWELIPDVTHSKLYLPLILNNYHPITTVNFNSTMEDGEALNLNCILTWSVCRNLAAGNASWQGLQVSTIGSDYTSSGYTIQRAFFYFDTSSIPANAIITEGKLMVYAGQWQNGSKIIHLVHSSASIPLTGADFGKVSFISGGSVTLPGPFNWATINLNQTALGWIARGSTTKLALIHDKDLTSSAPTESNNVLIATAEDTAHKPYLTLTYYLP
jgi:murein DD-endopeptidase MepM/ murein hydrolase activator NlpD